MENQAGRHGTATKGAEQNMMSVAAGLALEGKIPITGTCGVSVGVDGATHQALEEISLMAILPNMTVVVPPDAPETERLSRAAIFDVRGPAYIRYRGRKPAFRDAFETFLSTGDKAEGEDLAIVARGWPVPLRQPRGGRPVRGVRQALGVHGKVRIDRGAYRGARGRAERKGGR